MDRHTYEQDPEWQHPDPAKRTTTEPSTEATQPVAEQPVAAQSVAVTRPAAKARRTGVAAVLALALGVLLAPGEAVPPGMVLIIGIGAVGGLGIALLLLVMRALLAKAVALDTTASTLRAELDEVI